MTAWGACSLVQIVSTIPSPQTARSDTTPNRAFLRGFPATQFADLVSVGRWRVLAAIFGALSPHPKIPGGRA
jgi:hypothetical protein